MTPVLSKTVEMASYTPRERADGEIGIIVGRRLNYFRIGGQKTFFGNRRSIYI
jgi:hypothetical protein